MNYINTVEEQSDHEVTYTVSEAGLEERLSKIENTMKEILSRLDEVENDVERIDNNDDILYISQIQDYFDIIQNKNRWM